MRLRERWREWRRRRWVERRDAGEKWFAGIVLRDHHAEDRWCDHRDYVCQRNACPDDPERKRDQL